MNSELFLHPGRDGAVSAVLQMEVLTVQFHHWILFQRVGADRAFACGAGSSRSKLVTGCGTAPPLSFNLQSCVYKKPLSNSDLVVPPLLAQESDLHKQTLT